MITRRGMADAIPFLFQYRITPAVSFITAHETRREVTLNPKPDEFS